jgi:ABC-type phosphate/phosphonate transport system substrate-binding protein
VTAGLALVLGAVAYDAKVVTIWDGFRAWFAERGLDFDYVLYTSYERQVEAHLAGQLDVTWNSPLAWLQTEQAAARRGRRAEAIVMRDTDQDLTSVIVVRADAAIQTVDDLRGKRIGVGAADSPQATLIPLELVAAAGVAPDRDAEVVRHDVLVGKHGDHIGGERDAVKALVAGTVDAACILDANHVGFVKDGTARAGSLRVLAQTAPYDHCNMTVLDGGPAAAIARFRELLLGMSYDDPAVRPLLDLEGLKAWRPGRTHGYRPLAQAIERTGYLAPWLARVAAP